MEDGGRYFRKQGVGFGVVGVDLNDEVGVVGRGKHKC